MWPWGKLTVVVADGARARFLTSPKTPWLYATDDTLNAINAHRGAADLGINAPHADPHEHAKHDFAATVATAINAGVDEAVFDHFMLVAPDHVLADVEHALSARAKTKLVATLAKDLTKTPDNDIGAHIAPVLRRAVAQQHMPD